MSKSYSASYAAAGVDITAGYQAVELMKKHIARTKTSGAIDTIGGFGGSFLLELAGMQEPVLVSGTDGCGTKVKLAYLQNKHDTIGIDAVAMCVNDIICCGAKPLFFLDYIACGKNYPEKIAEIVGGVAEGCVQSGAALIGGETAEHPGLMPEDEYDLAGFAVGIVDKEKMFDKNTVKAGDVIVAIPSSGVHSNGFSLVRKVFTEEQLAGPLGAELLVPTRIYVKDILALNEQVKIKACAHITGGGTNLQAILDAQNDVIRSARVALVISSSSDAYALERAKEVLAKEFPELDEKIQLHIPDESSRRVGQSVAAASLPEIG